MRLVKGLTYLFMILMFIGIGSSWRVFLRREHLVIFAMNVLLLASIRIRYAQAGIDIRYFMPIVLVGLPWAALGFFQVAAWLVEWTRGLLAWTPSQRGILVGVLAVLAATGSLAEGRLAGAEPARRQMDLGLWILEHFGSQQILTGRVGRMRLVPLYSKGVNGDDCDLRRCMEGDPPPTIGTKQADVLLFWRYEVEPDGFARAEQRFASLGYRCVPSEDLPSDCGKRMLVFVRRDKSW